MGIRWKLIETKIEFMLLIDKLLFCWNRLTWSTRINLTIQATWLKLELIWGSIIHPSNGIFLEFRQNVMKNITHAVLSRILTSSSTSHSDEKLSSTLSTWSFPALESLICQSWCFICQLILARKSHFASAFYYRKRCFFCWYLKLYRRHHSLFLFSENIFSSLWY